MVSTSSKSWVIVQFKPNAYQLAVRNLRQQKFESFLPLEEIKKYKNGQYRSIHRPLFPGYMFVAFEKGSILWRKINCTIGVTKLLTINNIPYIVPNTLITAIMTRCNQKGVLLPKRNLHKDDRVLFTDGPLCNFLATVESIDEKQRVWVLIDLLGKETRILVETEKLKSVL
jgi:transcriptional antiterminator RfaH